jgi:hypothetical protein
VPLVTRPVPTPAEIVREAGAELQAPPTDALVRHDYAALGQDQLDVPEAQAEPVVEPNRVADYLGREAVTMVWVWRLFHSPSSPELLPNRQFA